jgi:hypothetical protein
MSIFSSIGAWFKKVFTSIRKDIAPVAVSITEGIKTALDSGVAGFIAATVDAIVKTHLAEDIVAALKLYIPKVLATELAIEGLPDNPTEQDILDFENKVIAAFGKVSDKSKLYTTLAASLYQHVKDAIADGKLTFAEAVAIIEESYQEYQQYLQENPQDKPTVS